MKKTYLYQFFDMYPDRAVTADELFEAMRLIPVTRERLSQMIAEGMANGWLALETVNEVDYYSVKRNEDE